jgi:hypothetical protein
MFFIQRGSQIVELVNAVIESVTAIANGAVGGAAKAIENAMSKALPVIIGFMASLLGLGGITDKIQNIIKRVRGPIEKAIDWVISQAVKFAKKIGNKLGFGKDKKNKDNKDNKSEEGKGASKNEHPQLAKQAIAELEKISGGPKDYKTLRQEKEVQAKQIEKTYTAKLKPGIKLSVHFNEAAKDEKDGDIDFQVVIAPNATVGSGTVGGGGGTPLERVRKTFNVPTLPRLFAKPDEENDLADLLCSHHTQLNGLINNDATKMQDLIIYIKDDRANKLANLINLNNILPAGKQVIKLDGRNDNASDPNSTNLISAWASCPLKADVTTYISNKGFEELRKLIQDVPVAELGAAVHIVGMWHASQPQRLQAKKMPGWAHVYKKYPPGGGISSPISFNPSELEGHVEKHLCNRKGNQDKDEPWRWMQRLGHSVTLSELQALVTLTPADQTTIFGSGNSINNQTSARYFFTTYLDNNPGVVPHFRDKWKANYANDATNSMRSGRAFVHSDDSGAGGTPIHISVDANPVFVIAKFVTNVVWISSAYLPTDLAAVVAKNEAFKVWDL